METVRQRNIATDWWWSQTEGHRINLCEKYGYNVNQAIPKLYNANIAYRCYEKETGNNISEL